MIRSLILCLLVAALVGCTNDGMPIDDDTAHPISTPAQAEHWALADANPDMVAAVQHLHGEGLTTDAPSAHVVVESPGRWALEVPVIALLSSVPAPAYESLVFQVVGDVESVYFVLADVPSDEAATDGGETPARPSYKSGGCGTWTQWRRTARICQWATAGCTDWAEFEQQQRSRICIENGYRVQYFQHRRVFRRCGC